MRLMNRYSFVLALLAAGCLSWSIACSGSDGDGDADADGDGDGDGDADGDNVLEFVSDETQFLQYGQAVNLQVRYLDAQGSPLPGAQIAWALAGDETGGSQLMGANSQTDGSGIASMRLTAGTSNATFQVQVTPPAGNALAFTVTVSDTSVGSLVLRMTYTGEQTFTQFHPYLWRGVACNTIDPENPTGVLVVGADVTRLTDRPRFDELEPGDDYTVGVSAEAGGEVTGWGCLQAVEVVGSQTNEVELTLTDIAEVVRFEGVYDLENNINFGDTLPPSVDAALTIFNELTDDNNVDCGGTDYGQDPGAFILDIVARQTCAWECEAGQDYDDCSEINHPLGDLRLLCEENFQDWDGAQSRFFGGCGIWDLVGSQAQDLINDQIADWVPDFLTNFIFIVGDLGRAIQMARISSVLTIEAPTELGSPFTHELRQMHVRLHHLDGSEPTEYTFDLADTGMTSLSAAETAGISGNLLTLHDHRFQLHFGKLLRYVYTTVLLPALGYDSTTEMLAEWIDCPSLAASVYGWLVDQGWGGITSESALSGYCDAGLAAAGPALENLIEDSVDEENVLTLAGTATGEDLDADDIAHELSDGVWEGEWTEGVMTGAVTGDFTGARR